ncbi:MAG TPA: cytochrome P450, partial [Acidimicrobiales bacterium]|nr:cytochrome P450 [Acidimicrobiales bacterium]
IADALFDEFLERGEGDFVAVFAAPFPALVIAELLGVHDDDRDAFRRWSTLAVDALTGGDVARYHEAKARLEDYVEAGVDARDELLRAGSTIPDDVLSCLTVARREGVISRQEARHLGYQLLVAGHETTTGLLGLMLYRLIRQPDTMRCLRADRALLPGAIEEALRFDSPVQGLFRTNAADCLVHGEVVPAGSKVQLLFASANRDPDPFSDPDEFRIDRERAELGRHVAFGWGIHHCIGAPLARLETRIAFERILDRMLDIELTGAPERNDSFVLHNLTRLPIRWQVAEEAR